MGDGVFDAFCCAEFFVEGVDFGDEVFVGEGLRFEVCGEGGDAELEGVDFLSMTFCLVAEGSLDLTLDTVYVRRDFCRFAGLGMFLVHVILDLLLQGRLLLFCIMKRLFQSFSLGRQL